MKQWLRVIIVIPLVLIIFSAGFLTGASHPAIYAFSADTQPQGTEKLFTPFWDAWNMVHERYVDPIDDQKLMEGAASGMLAALGDPHTAYMNPQLFEMLNTDLSGEITGIGATIRKDDATGGIVILSTIPGAPARQGGVKVGDIIVTVDGDDITKLPETDILNRVRGPEGTGVKLGLLRKGEKQLIHVTLTRAKIKIPVVEYQMYEGKIGYVKLSEFTSNAMDDLRNAFKALDADHLNGVIFDLRDDPGGELNTAIDVGSAFIKKGTLTIERWKPGTQDTLLKATGKLLVPENVPMVVLVNSGSASASELVSAALKDYKRAVVIGTTSYGKGSVQTWSALNGGGGARITIAHFYSPYGNLIHKRGITPDVWVTWDTDANPDYDPQLAEAFRVLRGEF